MSKTWIDRAQLAELLDISPGQARRLVDTSDITPRSGRKGKHLFDAAQVAHLTTLRDARRRRTDERTLSQAAAIIGVSKSAITDIMTRAGITPRVCGKLRLLTLDQVEVMRTHVGTGPPQEDEVTSARAAELLGVHMVTLPKLQKRAGFTARNHKQWRIYTLAQVELMRPHIRNRVARDLERGITRSDRELQAQREQAEVMRLQRVAGLEVEIERVREARRINAHAMANASDGERHRKIARIVMMLEDGRSARTIQFALDADDDMMRDAMKRVNGGAI